MQIETHNDWKHLLFYLGLALLTYHELDAVARHEWRILPGLSLLDDGPAMAVFILAHIPLFAILFWLTGHRVDAIRDRSQFVVDLFLVIHGFIHFALSGHPLYEFKPPIETITVYGGAIIGILHGALLLSRHAKFKRNQ